jgi:hypothetical protein
MAELLGGLLQFYATLIAGILFVWYGGRILCGSIGWLVDRHEGRRRKASDESYEEFLRLIEERTRAKQREEARAKAQAREKAKAKPANQPGPMERACTLLALPLAHDEAAFRAAYRTAIRKVHPDLGGSVEAAQRVNAAADFIRRHKGWG